MSQHQLQTGHESLWLQIGAGKRAACLTVKQLMLSLRADVNVAEHHQNPESILKAGVLNGHGHLSMPCSKSCSPHASLPKLVSKSGRQQSILTIERASLRSQ